MASRPDLPTFTPDDVRASDAPPTQVLSNGRYTTIVTAAGTGVSSYDAIALTRWVPDRTRDAYGVFVYVSDEESGAVWSAGAQPVRAQPDAYTACFAPGFAELRRTDHGIETTMEICVAPDADVELRRITIENHTAAPRRIAVTTYAEVVLNDPAADAGHPAFSKLFVQTERTDDGDGLLARRRPRSAAEPSVWLAHRLVVVGADPDGMEFETDRARFIGRGRTLAAPRALDVGVVLSGTTGAVLDPVLAIRGHVTVPARSRVALVALLVASATREEAERTATRHGDDADLVRATFEGARERALGVIGEVGWSTDDPMAARETALALGVAVYGAGTIPRFAAGEDVVADDRVLLAAAREIVVNGALDQLTRAGEVDSPMPPPRAGSGDIAPAPFDEPLRLFNGVGGFSDDGSEYVIRPERTADGFRWPPQPWTNVIANERVGFIASERGAGYTWSVNSRINRLTPWFNDPVTDPHGEALYLRDDDSDAFWSPTPGPVPGAGAYEIRHGWGYTRYLHRDGDLREETVMFVPRAAPVKITRLRITNDGESSRRLSLYSYAQWVLGGEAWNTAASITTEARGEIVTATNPDAGVFTPLVAFASIVPDPALPGDLSLTADRRAFLGTHGDATAPLAVERGLVLDMRAGAGLDPCAAFQLSFDLPPEETAEFIILLGEGADAAEVERTVRDFREPGAVDDALDEVRAFWRDLLSGVEVTTPSPAIDLMVNGWLGYQNLGCRVWGRSAFYQSGGAFGFRDQLQDMAALVYLAPERCREQILLHAAHQFAEGDVLHWWHPPASVGLRTHFSDDLLWLPYVTAFYVETTGDASVLDDTASFMTAEPLEPGEDEVYLEPEVAEVSASVYDHCCRAIDRSLTAGVHGLPLMGTGDWNDGMNRVGREGKGESVWLGFFLSYVLAHFIPICEQRGDVERATRYRAYAEQLALMLNDTGWDGGWYRRAYYDDGTPLGSVESDECRIDAIAQAWAVIAGIAPPDRAARALDAMEAHLVSERDGIIRLLTPAFDRTTHDPGYIKGYLPGVRENGGQYTHGALWAVRALAEVGRCERAASLLEMLSPVTHAATPERVATYQVEPYVIAADVYGVAPHVGRGGWTWYTGSAGWMFRVALESVLGFELVGGTQIVLRPCVPREWGQFSVRYRLPDRRTVYEIVVDRGESGSETTVTTAHETDTATVDDGAVRIWLQMDGAEHRVTVLMGDDITPRYDAHRREIAAS